MRPSSSTMAVAKSMYSPKYLRRWRTTSSVVSRWGYSRTGTWCIRMKSRTLYGKCAPRLANFDFHSSRNGAPDRIGDGGVGIAPLDDRPQALGGHPGGPYPDVRPGTEGAGRNGGGHAPPAALAGP